MPFWWNPNLARYQDKDTGQIVSRQSVLDDVNQSIATAMTAPAVTEDGVLSAGAATLANLTSAGIISPGDFEELFRQEIKREYIRQYLLGIGGVENMTPARYGQIGGMIAEQYRWLPGFIDDIASGNLTEGQIMNRAAMYINSAREAFERANRQVHLEAGFTEVRWIMWPPAHHCEGCEEFAEMGWTKIEDDAYNGAIPGSGSTPCRTNCRCFLEYR